MLNRASQYEKVTSPISELSHCEGDVHQFFLSLFRESKIESSTDLQVKIIVVALSLTLIFSVCFCIL